MPPEAAASDRGSSTRSGGTPRGPRICGPGRLCPACTMAGRRPALRAEAERTRVVVRWLSTTTRVPVGCGHIGFAQAPHPKADRACQPHGRSHLGVGLARRASQFPGRGRCSGACRTLLERRLPLPTRLGSRRVAAVAAGQVFDLPCRRRRQRPTADRRQGAAGRRVVREFVAPDACALRAQWQVEDLPYARKRSEPALSCDGSARQRGFPSDAVTSDSLRLRIPRLTGPVSPTAGAISAWGWHAVPAIPGTRPMLGGLQNPA